MKNVVVLNKKNSREVIRFNFESPFVRIIKISIPSFTYENMLSISKIISCVSVDVFKSDSKSNDSHEESLYIGSNHLKNIGVLTYEVNKPVIFNNDFDSLELIYNNVSEEDLEIYVHYQIVNNDVSLSNPFENFKRHIKQLDNVKILFSAPFGQGKTTFLNYFFEQHSDQYEVFKVFPVNYSISHNEDIFKYIKAEILFKLLKTGVKFDEESFSYSLTAQQFLLNDPIRLLAPLLKLIPKIGKDAYEIYGHLKNLFNEFSAYHKKMKISDEQKAKDFIEELYRKEGSIFEDNFYTQLIRQLLERLQVDSGKENVLIIEDLDRMDPDHIFRILNIFAAHFDSPESTNDGTTNKFGFDKIIIVGDYNNIKHTFAYRYGDKVDFGGYINKYYSTKPFDYDNKAAISQFCLTLAGRRNSNHANDPVSLLNCVLNDLIDSECITLRDLIKLKKHNPGDWLSVHFHKSSKHSKSNYNYFLYFTLFSYLSNAFDINSLIQKFNLCKDKLHSNTKWNYDYYISIGLPSLAFNGGFADINQVPFKNLILKFEITQDRHYEYFCATNLSDIDLKPVKFNKSDFYDMLILNAEKYNAVGGFD